MNEPSPTELAEGAEVETTETEMTAAEIVAAARGEQR
jgi:hypothetical protein